MTPLLPDILAEFETRPLADLTPEEKTLLELSYSLAMVAPAVEFFGQTAVVCGFDSRKFLPTHEAVADRPVMSIARRSEEHTSELQSLMRISYAVFCLKKKKKMKATTKLTTSIHIT